VKIERDCTARTTKVRAFVSSAAQFAPEVPLLSCKWCGSAITGERIEKKLKSGELRSYDYYRCTHNNKRELHPIKPVQLRIASRHLEDEFLRVVRAVRIEDPCADGGSQLTKSPMTPVRFKQARSSNHV